MTEELIHVRCTTCGKVIGNKWDKFERLITEGVSAEQAMNKLGLTRYCCRMRMMNPFKVAIRSERQIGVSGLESPTENLNVAQAKHQVPDPLELMSGNSTSPVPPSESNNYIIVPPVKTNEGELAVPELPDIPSIPSIFLPSFQPGDTTVKKYTAW